LRGSTERERERETLFTHCPSGILQEPILFGKPWLSESSAARLSLNAQTIGTTRSTLWNCDLMFKLPLRLSTRGFLSPRLRYYKDRRCGQCQVIITLVEIASLLVARGWKKKSARSHYLAGWVTAGGGGRRAEEEEKQRPDTWPPVHVSRRLAVISPSSATRSSFLA
jgi:hypothetical protein